MKIDWQSLGMGLAGLLLQYGTTKIANPQAASWTETKSAAANFGLQWAGQQIQNKLQPQQIPPAQ